MACSNSVSGEPENLALQRSVAQITDPELAEISGITASTRIKDHFWVINDSGNKPELYLINPVGQRVGELTVAGVKNYDWEDLAGIHINGQPYLLIADIGDNFAQRDILYLHFVAELAIQEWPKERIVQPNFSIPFVYEDGARDAEAIAVDPATNQIFILTKRDSSPRLYTVPLDTSGRQVTAHLVATLDQHPKPSLGDIISDPRFGPYRYSPTAMAFSPAGDKAAVLGYHQLFLYQRDSNQSWPEAFARSPRVLWQHNLKQAEAATFTVDGNSVLVTSEKLPAPLIEVGL